jgi:hypothetical protein
MRGYYRVPKKNPANRVDGALADLVRDISNNVGPVKHFLSRLIHSLKRVFSSASFSCLAPRP